VNAERLFLRGKYREVAQGFILIKTLSWASFVNYCLPNIPTSIFLPSTQLLCLLTR
jgi:hypothetical protein